MRRGNISPNRRWTAVWLAGLALAVASPLAAQTPTPSDEASPVATDDTSEVAPSAGLRVFVDPDTGEIISTPTREQIDQLERLIAEKALANTESVLSRSSDGLQTFELASGGRGVHLEGRFQSALVVRMTDQGELEMVCRNDDSHPHEHAPTDATVIDTAPTATTPILAAPTEWAEQ